MSAWLIFTHTGFVHWDLQYTVAAQNATMVAAEGLRGAKKMRRDWMHWQSSLRKEGPPSPLWGCPTTAVLSSRSELVSPAKWTHSCEARWRYPEEPAASVPSIPSDTSWKTREWNRSRHLENATLQELQIKHSRSNSCWREAMWYFFFFLVNRLSD